MSKFETPPSRKEKKKRLEEAENNKRVDDIASGADISTNTKKLEGSEARNPSRVKDDNRAEGDSNDTKVSDDYGVNEAVKRARKMEVEELDNFIDSNETRSTVWDIYLQKTGRRHQNDDRDDQEGNGASEIDLLRKEQKVERYGFRIYPIDMEMIKAGAEELELSQRQLIERALDLYFEGQENTLLEIIEEKRQEEKKKGSRLSKK